MELTREGKEIVFVWVPGHVSIRKNSAADLSLAETATSIKCRDKTIKNYKSFAATNICLDKHNFVATIFFFAVTSLPLSRQTRVCHYKTRLLLRQKYACRDKIIVATNTCLSR